MIPLESKEWASLNDAYGNADDIPDLLKAIYDDPSGGLVSTKDVWFDLWSSLCHQGDIYTASIAAVPHIIAAALHSTERPFAIDTIHLPLCIEKSRLDRPSQADPNVIDTDYWDAIIRLGTLCDLASANSVNPDQRIVIKQARSLLSKTQRRGLPLQKTNTELGPLFELGSDQTK